ncbi:TrbI/VirB10 family protein [Sphingomonas endophytica]|nr:TrbI/VirB10 family protein [Sphingomonas endophytica]
MRLRPEPPRVTRMSRKALAVLGGVASVGLGGALIYALQVQQGGKPAEEVYAAEGRSTPDGLAALPKDYTGPVLGPPLPGDLGRPILDAQNRGQPVPVPGIDAPAGPAAPDAEIERRRQELERRRQEVEAARTSRVFFQSGAQTPATSGVPSDGMPNLAGMGTPGQTGTPTAQDRQLAFLNQPADRRTVAPDRVTGPPSPYVVQAGAVIPAALITGIRSDLPGQIVAQVTENVYDSPTGRLLLIPQGTRLIGQYDNGVGFGQRRVLLAWTRLIFPNGRSIVLERQPGADAQGYAGLEDGVDHHWWDLAKAAGLSTLLSVGAQAGSSGEQGDLVRALRQGASDGISQAGRQVVGRQLDIAPTLTIRPGFPVRVIVTRDLVLEPYRN